MYIDTDLVVEFRDAGVWRSYNMTAEGRTYEELEDSVTIAEIDRDGGELACYGLDEAPNDVYDAVMRVLMNEFEKQYPEE